MGLKILKKSGEKMQLTQVIDSMGVLNVKLGYYYKALGNFQQVARIFGEIGNESMVAQSYNLIGSVYLRKSHFDLEHEVLTFGPRMSHDDTIDALAYACKYASPPTNLTQSKDGLYTKNRPKPKNWIVA